MKKSFLTLNNMLTFLGLFVILFLIFLYLYVPSLFGNVTVRVLIAILIVAVIVYFKVRDFIRIKSEKVYFKDKQIREKREAVLNRDKPLISKAIEDRDLDFLWQKSQEYGREIYLWDKAEELWKKLKELDSTGYYRKKAQERLDATRNPDKKKRRDKEQQRQ
jgi:small-conductance mechanosensitive channel